MFARQTSSGPGAIQKLDTTKAKTRSRLAETTEEADFDSQVLCPVWQPETKSSILILNQRPPISSSFFCFVFFTLVICHVLSFLLLMSFTAGVVSQQPQDLISPASGLLRGIYGWRVMAGNFNAQLIMSQNKWGSSSTVHSQWQVTFTWMAELGICQHHAGLLELPEAMAAVDAQN